VIVFRLVVFLALLTIVAAGVFYLTTRDRRYLTFIRQVIRYTLLLLAGVMLFWGLERLVLVL
jgi:hypothetical protein